MIAFLAFAPTLPAFIALCAIVLAFLALARPVARPWEAVTASPAMGIAVRATHRAHRPVVAVVVRLVMTSAPRPLMVRALPARDKRGNARRVADAARAAIRKLDAWAEHGDPGGAWTFDPDPVQIE